MNKNLIFIFILFSQIGISQQYNSVIIEEENIDSNNEIYKTGNVFIYDYEIIKDGKKFKLKKNNGMFAGSEFELEPIISDSIEINKIHLIVQPINDSERSNENQTQISYLQDPIFSSISSTGVVENELNVWMHPIRKGFFNSLETAPFPYIKKPLEIGSTWTDQMKIGQGWGNELWGKWKGQLLLTYEYQITERKIVNTEIGEIDCFIVKSYAKSDIGTSMLTTYFSEKYGFIRMEYDLLNELEVNIWLIDYKTNKEFNDSMTFFKTKNYIKQ